MTTRRLLLAAAAIAATALAACHSQQTVPADNTKPKPPPQAAPTQLPPPPQPGRTDAAPSRDTTISRSSRTTPSAADEAAPVSRDSLRVRFGIKPAYDDDTAGVLVEDVYPGTSAADAGIKPDDRLITWNGQQIRDVPEWMHYMSAHNPGDTVEVGVLRSGKKLPLQVTLKAPAQ